MPRCRLTLAFSGDLSGIICAHAEPRTNQTQIVMAKSLWAGLKEAQLLLMKYLGIADSARFVVPG